MERAERAVILRYRTRAHGSRSRPRGAADRGRRRKGSGARRGHHRAALAGGIAYRSQAAQAPAVRRARGGPGDHRPAGRRRTPPETSRADCKRSYRRRGGRPASVGVRLGRTVLARPPPRGRARSRRARPASPLAPARRRGAPSQLRRRPPGGRAQGRRRSGGGGRGLRGGRRDRPGRAPLLREARGHGDARQGAGRAGPPARSRRSVPACAAAADRGGFELSPAAGVVHIGMADLLYERDDLDGAESALERGVELAERTGDVSTLVWAYVTLSRAKRAWGDEGGALEMARQAERVARDSGADLQIAIASSWMTRLLLARGDLREAVALEQERAANADDAADAARVVDRITSARLLHAQGRHREALALLEELGETAEAAGRTGDLLEILALQALALRAGSKKERAVSTLARALALAE